MQQTTTWFIADAGTMQALDARHWELFFQKEYKDCEWSYEQVSARNIAGHCIEAAACVFDADQFRRKDTQSKISLCSPYSFSTFIPNKKIEKKCVDT